jgi:hypothetical protein
LPGMFGHHQPKRVSAGTFATLALATSGSPTLSERLRAWGEKTNGNGQNDADGGREPQKS